MKTRILIVDDHTIVRMGLAALLRTERDFDVVGEAANGEEAVAKAVRLAPDVILMDLMMPKMDGIAATAEIHGKAPSAKVLILTTFGTSDGIARALKSGASGALMKSAENADLIRAIRTVVSGERYLSPEVEQQIEADPPVPELTPRQKDVLASMVKGLSNPDIARTLGIRRDGVAEHVNAILQKIGAANRTEAVAIAVRKQLLKI